MFVCRLAAHWAIGEKCLPLLEIVFYVGELMIVLKIRLLTKVDIIISPLLTYCALWGSTVHKLLYFDLLTRNRE